jgi:RNA polymerase sigma-70 factor (ECF subfamily)
MAELFDTRSDAQLVDAVNRGDWGAFDVLYHRHKAWAFRIGWRFAGNEADALDAVQEAFIYLAGKCRGRLDLRVALTTLLYPAVKHCALAAKRKRRRHEPLGQEIDVPAPMPGVEPSVARQELAGVLAGLSDAHREIVLLRFVDDLSLEEIAAALAIPLGTAKSRLHHAIAALREDPKLERFFADLG